MEPIAKSVHFNTYDKNSNLEQILRKQKVTSSPVSVLASSKEEKTRFGNPNATKSIISNKPNSGKSKKNGSRLCIHL